MKIEFTAWKVTDSHGNEDGDVIRDFNKSVQVSGIKDAEGKSLYFENEFRYLTQWCIENKLSYYTSFNSVDI